ncbi:MAG: hypothetical protein ACOH5I_10285 [Oligoflexus sp.]
MREIPTQFSKLLPYLWISVLGLSLVHCGDDKEDTSAASGSKFDQLHATIFKSCSNCHGQLPTFGTEGGPDFSTKDLLYENLVNGKGADYPDWLQFQSNRKDCENILFVKPGSPEESLVVAILDADVRATMPCELVDHTAGDQRIPTSNLPLLKEWISEGAPK